MDYLQSKDIIIACATGDQTNSAIAVIRISGFENIKQFSSFFSTDLSVIEPRRVYLTDIIDQDRSLDNVLITFFKAPNSYTGENLLEISVHGNQRNIHRIISLFLKIKNCSYAHPGEFTYRALRNKKLSLAQVEGLDLLLNANSDFVLDQGNSLLRGELQRNYLELRESFLKLKSSVELSIDFLEDIGEEVANQHFTNSLKDFSKRVDYLHSRTRVNANTLISPKIVVLGNPNAGKSSFFNKVLKFSRSIVSSIPGTTRDYVTELAQINNVDYSLVDTAGIRYSSDLIESIGVKRAIKLAEDAFFKILIINPFDREFSDFQIFVDMNVDCIVFSHADGQNFEDAKKSLLHLPECSRIFNYSLIGDDSLNNLFDFISTKYDSLIGQNPIVLPRHKETIDSIYKSLVNFQQIASSEDDVAIISSELNLLGHKVEELVGILPAKTVFASIFDNFCIGK